MKILVLSDSHGCTDIMCDIIDYEKPDFLIHLGDHSRDAEYLKNRYPFLPIRNVKGNCDLGDFETAESFVSSYGLVRIFATHGHNYGVKNSYLRLYMAAKENVVDVALFGHTHHAYCELKDGIWLLNPGSCASRNGSTYAIVKILNDKAECFINSLHEREVKI